MPDRNSLKSGKASSDLECQTFLSILAGLMEVEQYPVCSRQGVEQCSSGVEGGQDIRARDTPQRPASSSQALPLKGIVLSNL